MLRLLYFCVVLVVLEGCEEQVRMECDPDTLAPNFPETEQQLEDFCKFYLKHLECALEVLSKTEEECEKPDYPELIEETYHALDHTCDKNTALYRNLARSLPCIDRVMYGLSCNHWSTFPGEEEFKTFLLGEDSTELASNEYNTSECLNRLFYMSCFPAVTGVRCDETARDVVIEFLLRFDVIFKPCYPGIKYKLPDIVRTLEAKYPRRE